ncbi:VOC family protein [Brevibacillus fluminis]|uniref:VOC family protein n=1 Tax=Brevibacillus fluminis TaxID=511487 RepID=A0A3M8DPH8_9BACL|nr:VOC family protein [Brevibacillus fluminis]RNB89962.1 VOC family protein [Brevibacillus fluminis]
MGPSTQKMTPFFLFSGQAEEAMNFYTSIFDDSEINHISHHADGKVLQASFTLKGQQFKCIDNTNGDRHAFTPALSIFVTCDTDDEIEHVFAKLSDGGFVMMPLASYPFSEKFAWVADRFGVSWQLNLAKQ